MMFLCLYQMTTYNTTRKWTLYTFRVFGFKKIVKDDRRRRNSKRKREPARNSREANAVSCGVYFPVNIVHGIKRYDCYPIPTEGVVVAVVFVRTKYCIIT